MSRNETAPPQDDRIERDAEAAVAVRVLLVDDSPLIQRLVTERLAADRMDVTSVGCGADVMKLIHELQPDVVLLDLELPDAHGLHLLTVIKANPETNDVPVIALSATSDTSVKVRAFELGAMDYITKPFDIAEARARVRSAVRMRRLIVMLAQRAQIDGLTGLYNRAHFDVRLAQEIAEAERFDTRLSLILCDLDRFKAINDTYGHPFGDRVLEVFAQILLAGRMSDTACRYGGEEFAVILPRAAAGEAAGVAERFREAITAVQWEGHVGLRLTASFGVADLGGLDDPSARALVAAADTALYDAKQAGRDRVCTAAPIAVKDHQTMRRTA